MTAFPLVRPAPAGTRARRRADAVPAVLALAGVAVQVCYPLTHGALRDRLTLLVVLLLAAACLTHAAVSRGVRVAGALAAVSAGGGLGVEIVGLHTGVPFGRYAYTGVPGPHLLGVPLVVPLAWTMLAWPAVLAARQLTAGRPARILAGAWALAAADLFLDPQMVAAGYWRWAPSAGHLPGVPAVPLSNLAGWCVVAVAMSAALDRVLARRPAPAPLRTDRVPLLLYTWLWAGWTVALAAFLGLPVAAGYGCAAMGAVAVPLLARLRR